MSYTYCIHVHIIIILLNIKNQNLLMQEQVLVLLEVQDLVSTEDQDLALADVKKGADMFNKVNTKTFTTPRPITSQI